VDLPGSGGLAGVGGHLLGQLVAGHSGSGQGPVEGGLVDGRAGDAGRDLLTEGADGVGDLLQQPGQGGPQGPRRGRGPR
jgi:hypothetical protein